VGTIPQTINPAVPLWVSARFSPPSLILLARATRICFRRVFGAWEPLQPWEIHPVALSALPQRRAATVGITSQSSIPPLRLWSLPAPFPSLAYSARQGHPRLLPSCFRGLGTIITVGNPPGYFPGPPVSRSDPITRSFVPSFLLPPHPPHCA